MNEDGQAFVRDGSARDKTPFHYTQCGLDNVYLVSGSTLKDTAYGQSFTIRNIEGLHRAIARQLVRGRKTLNAKEIRFLRKQMGHTQDALGTLIGVGVQQVARYEKAETPIPPAQEMLLRGHTILHILPEDESVRELKRAFAEVAAAMASDDTHEPIYLKVRGDDWNTVKMAA